MSFATWTRHEWKQLRLVRRVSLLLTFAVPFVLLAGAAASHRGWMPGAPLRVWDARTVLYDAAPLVLAAVWGLVAALATGQVFSGGRASGTEWLVLSLPVRRRTVWTARAVAALATTVIVAVLSLGFLLAIASFTSGSAPTLGWPSGAAAGAIAVVIATLGTAAVAPMLRQPFQAALAGMVVGAVPLGVATWVASAFPLATTPAGMPLAPVAVLPAYPALVLVSFLASSRGEPAGRGRVVRAIVVVTVALATGVVLFVGTSIASVRLGRQIERAYVLAPAPAGDRAVGVRGHFAQTYTLYDTATGAALSLLARSTTHNVAWSESGDRFVIVEDATMTGRVTAQHLAVHRGSDGALLERVRLGDEVGLVAAMEWCGDRVVVSDWGSTLHVLRDGVLSPIGPKRRDDEFISLVGCVSDDRILVSRGESPSGSSRSRRADGSTGGARAQETELLLVPLDGVDDPTTIPARVDFAPWRARARLSREGRYLVTQGREIGANSIEVLDLSDGSRHRLDDTEFGLWGWLADGRLVWAEDGGPDSSPSIRVWRPGGPLAVHEIDAPDATSVTMHLSPDARRVLVRASHREGDTFLTDRLAIFDPGAGDWSDVPHPAGLARAPFAWVTWASSSSVFVHAPDRVGELIQIDP